MSASPAISFDHVTVRYGERTAVDDVTLDVPSGSITVLLGQSGSGKSTLLRTVNRLVIPAAGRILVNGSDVRDAVPAELRRGIGYVIQAVGLFPHMSVAQNVAIVPQLLGWDRARIARRVDELLDLMHLEPSVYRERLPRELSGGEAQRAGVARALAAEPHVLLMDEPFGAVDPLVRSDLQAETLRIQRTLGTTFLFVTHDVDEALRVADRIVVMHAGRLLQFDTPLRMLAHPVDDYVASFLDTHDNVRKLGLIAAGPAARAGRAATDAPSIPAQGSLREALDALLSGASQLNVVDRGQPAGVLDFSDIRRAIADL